MRAREEIVPLYLHEIVCVCIREESVYLRTSGNGIIVKEVCDR